jgi:hypothetical protein
MNDFVVVVEKGFARVSFRQSNFVTVLLRRMTSSSCGLVLELSCQQEGKYDARFGD